MYLLSPHHDKNFHHCLSMNEILEDLVIEPKKEKPKRRSKYRPAKRRVKVETEERFLNRKIALETINYIILGVINAEFRFILPASKGEIKMTEVYNKGGFFQHYNLDPLECNLEAYRIMFRCVKESISTYDKHSSIHVSGKYRDIITKRLQEQKNFVTLNELNVPQVSKIIRDLYFKKYPVNRIKKVVFHLFKYIRHATIKNVDLVFQPFNGEYVVDYIYIKNTKYNLHYNKVSLFKRKLRFLDHFRRPKYNGYYYFALTHQYFNTMHLDKSKEVKLHLIMQEAMLEPNGYPHIFRVKVKRPLMKKYTISRIIDYEKNNTEYIWRWNEQRFESVDNSQLRINRCT